MSLTRRDFLTGSAAALMLGGCKRLPWEDPPTIEVLRPGMQMGHWLRDRSALPLTDETVHCDIAIIGSGAAGLSAAWKLTKEGRRSILLIDGPEPDGNAAGGRFGDYAYPTGAHYLPLPSMASFHVREMLSDLSVIERDALTERPTFDEHVIVHALEERCFENGRWVEGIMQPSDEDSRRFFAFIASLLDQQGHDGRKLFTVPIVLSSTDEAWRRLDRHTFTEWLEQNGYTSPRLLWYVDYCCRDDYGMGSDRVSAWAGLHYFCARAGQARNAETGAVMTWPDGLQTLMQKLRQCIGLQPLSNAAITTMPRRIAGFAAHIRESDHAVAIQTLIPAGDRLRGITIQANAAICAMPLYAASHVVEDLAQRGFINERHLPDYAPWMISNFLLNAFPREAPGAPLAWDNVPYGTKALGYVVSTHQLFRVAKPPKTVFSAYYALDHLPPQQTREWLLHAHDRVLADLAATDLYQVYGPSFLRHSERIRITLRGHAMASPLPGYLSNPGLQALREYDGKLKFAHSDLSGYSIFEEAAWWGYQAALALL